MAGTSPDQEGFVWHYIIMSRRVVYQQSQCATCLTNYLISKSTDTRIERWVQRRVRCFSDWKARALPPNPTGFRTRSFNTFVDRCLQIASVTRKRDVLFKRPIVVSLFRSRFFLLWRYSDATTSVRGTSRKQNYYAKRGFPLETWKKTPRTRQTGNICINIKRDESMTGHDSL